MLPVPRLINEGHAPLPPRTEEHSVDGHSLGVLEGRRDRLALRRRHREAAVGVGRLLRRCWRPRPPLPVERRLWRWVIVPFPPGRAVWTERNIGVDGVA